MLLTIEKLTTFASDVSHMIYCGHYQLYPKVCDVSLVPLSARGAVFTLCFVFGMG